MHPDLARVAKKGGFDCSAKCALHAEGLADRVLLKRVVEMLTRMVQSTARLQNPDRDRERYRDRDRVEAEDSA